MVAIIKNFIGKRRERKQQKSLLDELDCVKRTKRIALLPYSYNAGAVGFVSDFEGPDSFDYVRSDKFFQCAGVCISDKDRQLFMHVSPLSLPELEGGVRGYGCVSEPRLSFMEALCKGLSMFESGKTGPLGRSTFSGFDLKGLQKKIDSGDLKCDIISGDYTTGGEIAIKLSNEGNSVCNYDFSDFSIKGLPRFNVSLYDFGPSEKTIYSGKDGFYVLNDKAYKTGVNFPEAKRFPFRRN